MTTYSFTVVVTGADLTDPDAADALYGGGLDDTIIRSSGGVQLIDVDRDADSYTAAVLSVIDQLRVIVPTVRVERIEPDELVTLQDIADLTGRTRESVRLLILGERGPGDFPAPVVHAGRSRLWRLVDVADWMTSALGDRTLHGLADTDVSRVNARLNAALQLHRGLGDLDDGSRRDVLKLAGI